MSVCALILIWLHPQQLRYLHTLCSSPYRLVCRLDSCGKSYWLDWVITSLGNNVIVMLVCWFHFVIRKISTSNMNMDDKRKMRYAYEVWRSCVLCWCCNYSQSPLCEGVVYLHPASTLLNSCPQYVVFQELLETTKQCIRGTVNCNVRTSAFNVYIQVLLLLKKIGFHQFYLTYALSHSR